MGTYSDVYDDTYGEVSAGVEVTTQELTAAQIVSLVEADTLEVDFGCDLFDSDEQFLDDISGDLVGGQVERGNYRTIHGTCRLVLSRELQWGSQRVQPWMTLSDGVTTARFPLGVFLLTTPTVEASETPRTFDVDGYDKLEVLNHPHGTSYAAAAGSSYLALVEQLIVGAGETKVLLDRSADDATLPTLFTRPLDEQVTTLNIVNDLLAAVGYRALWCDRDGFYRSEPYVSPSLVGPMWTYDAQSPSTSVGEQRTAEADFFGVPNRWVFVLDDPEAGTFPSAGDGIYTVVNQSDGPTSVDGRGRTISRVVRLDASSQASLVTQGDRMVESDKRLVERLRLLTSPNPQHFHFDVVRVKDDELSVDGRFLVTDWELPLTGEDMTLHVKSV